MLFLASINAGIAQTQVAPDGTLPTVVEQLENMRKITGGERVGNNLFHSFEEFSIPEGIEAIFENTLDIENIFTRITGNEISFIDGLLQTAGGANFFLINPNGIIFGENARLDIGGSLIATTADSIEFADGTNFAARGDEPKVSLTISVPIGLGLYRNNGSITVNGTGNQIANDSSFSPVQFSQIPSGLSVKNGQNLALIGNRVNLNSGVITTEGGQIYLTSVNSGSVGITQSENGLIFLNDGVTGYQDINLGQQSLIDASGKKVGSVFVSGKGVNLSNASFILAQNQGNSSDGSINIQASESIVISGTNQNITSNNPGSTIRTAAQAASPVVQRILGLPASPSGNAGNLTINTPLLNVFQEGVISVENQGTGSAGKLTITADNLNLDESGSITAAAESGLGGNIGLNTQNLNISNDSQITTAASGNEDGGNITINTTNLTAKKKQSNNS